MTRVCAFCGGSLEGLRSTAKFCASKCRKAAARARAAEPQERDSPPPPPEAAVVVALRRELTEAGVLDTVDGHLALGLAGRFEEISPAGLVGLTAEFRRVRAEALARAQTSGAPGPEPVEDEVQRARRIRQEKVAEARASAGLDDDPGPAS